MKLLGWYTKKRRVSQREDVSLHKSVYRADNPKLSDSRSVQISDCFQTSFETMFTAHTTTHRTRNWPLYAPYINWQHILNRSFDSCFAPGEGLLGVGFTKSFVLLVAQFQSSHFILISFYVTFTISYVCKYMTNKTIRNYNFDIISARHAGQNALETN